MVDIVCELRELMHKYIDRRKSIEKERKEAKEMEDYDALSSADCMIVQCNKMITELWQVMVRVGALDEEEIEFGSIKIGRVL